MLSILSGWMLADHIYSMFIAAFITMFLGFLRCSYNWTYMQCIIELKNALRRFTYLQLLGFSKPKHCV